MADDFARGPVSFRAEPGHAAIMPAQGGGELASRLREALWAAHEELLARDREFDAITRELMDLKEAAETELVRKVGEIAAERAYLQGLRDALEAWHSRSEAEFAACKQGLVAEREAARVRADHAEKHSRMLESRIEHALMVRPRQVAGRVRRWIGRPRTG